MADSSDLARDDIPGSLERGEFEAIYESIEAHIQECGLRIEARWIVYAGLARYFNGDTLQALKHFAAVLARNPDHVAALNNTAYVLACCHDDKFHNAKDAVLHASRACELTDWNDWLSMQILAAAYARDEDFDTASDFAKAALAMAPEDKHWRCERLLALFDARTAFTGTLDDDFQRMLSDLPDKAR